MGFRPKISIKQRQLAKIMTNGNYISKKDAVTKAGYSPKGAHNPAQALDTRGYSLALLAEATKVGHIVDALTARLDLEDWSTWDGKDVVDALKKVSEAQKNILTSLPKPKESSHDASKWSVIDIDPTEEIDTVQDNSSDGVDDLQ